MSNPGTLEVKKFEVSQKIKTALISLVTLGILTFIVGLILNKERLWTSYLTAFFYITCMSVGALFFIAIHHVAKAGWIVGIRRIAEGFTAFIPGVILGSLVLLAGASYLFPWLDKAVVAESSMIQAKTAYLNLPFLVIRLLVFGFGMLFFAKKIVGFSLKQDAGGSSELTNSSTNWSVGFILFFALSFTLFSMDLLMTLLPTWYSTIFGIYCLAGMIQGSLAMLILVLYYLKNQGFVKGYFTEEHIHDVAKYLKGFTIFWAYIAFSQFMLIWYANIPEETEYYLIRAQGSWMTISFALLVFKFIVPFLVLLPRGSKRNPGILISVCVLMLVMQYLDVYWMVYPNFNEGHAVFGVYELGMLSLFLGLFGLSLTKFYSTNSLVAVKDPRMEETLHHHVV